MRAGGIWSPFLGTFFLVGISLVVAAPIGVLAGVYLNEYARDNWFTRIVNLAVVNLAGVPSIVHALFGVGAFVLFAGMGKSVLAASLHAGRHDAAGDHHQHQGGAGLGADGVPRGLLEPGGHALADDPHVVLPNSISGILTGVILQVSRAAGETAPILFTGAVFFKAMPSEGDLFPYGLFDQCMALSMHLFTLCHPGAGRAGGAAVRHGRRADRPGAAGQQRCRSGPRSACGRGRNGEAAVRMVEVERPPRPLRPARGAEGRDARRPPRTRSSAIIGPANRARRRCSKCINRTIDVIAGRRGDRHGPGRRRGRAQDPERLRAAPPDRHGLSAAGRAAAVGLRQRGLRPAHGRRPRPRATSTNSSSAASGRRCSGTR